jgi:hypothetical protein
LQPCTTPSDTNQKEGLGEDAEALFRIRFLTGLPMSMAYSPLPPLQASLERIGDQIQFGMFVERLAAVIACQSDHNIAALVIRNYIAALFGGQEMEPELKLVHLRIVDLSERRRTMPAYVLYSHR